ncbi:MAG: GldG family protein [Ignavibacteria bacterium]|nr:GldG family protein [Ignavibacteria bacterium]
MSEELENKDELKEEEESVIEESSEELEEDERLSSRKKKTESRRRQAFISILLVVGILVVVNIIALQVFFRWDLTPNKIYTLSDASKSIVSKLDDKLVVKAYFTENLPAPYNNNRRYLQELLDDYRNASNGKISYEIISPSNETELENEAQKYGIQPVQVQTVQNDRAEALKAYMGMVLLYGGKQEAIPFVSSTENLEYDITGVINRLTQAELKKVGVMTGASMPGVEKISKVNQYLSKFYNVTNIDASKNNPIPADVKTLIVFSPKAAPQQNQMMQQQAPPEVVPENLKFAIDQYIMGGGRVIFLLNKVNVSSQQQFQIAQVTQTGLEDMLESYGAKINNTIIIDKECAFVSVPVQQGPIQMYTQIPFPYYPKILNINKEIPSFAAIGQVFLGFTSDLDLNAAGPKGVKVMPLLTTSPKTGVNTDFAVVQATGKMLPDSMFKAKDLPVGAIYDGVFQSFYKGKQIPLDTTAGSNPAPTSVKETSPSTKIVLLGNGDFAQDDFRGPDENLLFFANTIDYMTDDAGLSMIRMKDANPKPLSAIEDSTKSLVKYGMLVGPPLLVLVYGLMRWRKKKAARG